MSAFALEPAAQGPQGDTGPAGTDTRTLIVTVSDQFTDAETGDGQGWVFVPADLDGFNLTAVAAGVTTVGTAGTALIQIRNATQAVDMLTTRISIDPSENHSKDSAAAVIDAANDDVAYGDLLYVDVDVISTGMRGLQVALTFTAP